MKKTAIDNFIDSQFKLFKSAECCEIIKTKLVQKLSEKISTFEQKTESDYEFIFGEDSITELVKEISYYDIAIRSIEEVEMEKLSLLTRLIDVSIISVKYSFYRVILLTCIIYLSKNI